jgi:ribosomal protein S18 acetylase RimI-like enzyme
MSAAPPDFVVFPAGPADDEALARVHVTAWRETYSGLLSDSYLSSMSPSAHARWFHEALIRREDPDVILAASDRGGLFGYAQAMASRRGAQDEAEISTLYLLRSAQKRGAGLALVRGCARAMAARGCVSLVISVLRDNVAARGFYEHLGGLADAPRPELGPGGVLHEVRYRWPDITALT